MKIRSHIGRIQLVEELIGQTVVLNGSVFSTLSSGTRRQLFTSSQVGAIDGA